MIFTTPAFVVFFALFFAVHFSLRGEPRKWWLLAASYYFYGSWNALFLLLIIGSTLVDFYVGRALHATEDQRRRNRLLWLSCAVNLGALAFFKYANFGIETLNLLLASLGVGPVSWPAVVLPVGISFYTFQTLSYTIDVYRGSLKPAKSFLSFAAFVMYFPQLVAGPIVRASELLPQLEGGRPRVSSEGVSRGLFLIALG
ncbi:MAG: MBOAT family protein, partial [Anaerolineae bacterium]|nr:MBOAT family protein [Anaerolineae bacterium]